MVSRNLERANENDGFKMTALEYRIERQVIANITSVYEHMRTFNDLYLYIDWSTADSIVKWQLLSTEESIVLFWGLLSTEDTDHSIWYWHDVGIIPVF